MPAAGIGSAPLARTSSAHAVGETAVTVAMRQLGTPYRYGGQSPSGFDCSGLVHFSYLQAGMAVPRTTRQLWKDSMTVSRSDLQKGDLLFFSIEGKMQHVGLYIGDDRFIHAPSSGKYVRIESLDSDFYSDALLRSARPR
jgi:cell wall-associated NlpC family hydrolase